MLMLQFKLSSQYLNSVVLFNLFDVFKPLTAASVCFFKLNMKGNGNVSLCPFAMFHHPFQGGVLVCN